MNKELVIKWIEALRSGDYKQTTGVLQDLKGGFCCLGVLCDIDDNSLWTDTNIGLNYCGEFNIPPIYIRKLAGIGDHMDMLWRMNDTLGMSFDEIADYIEREILNAPTE